MGEPTPFISIVVHRNADLSCCSVDGKQEFVVMLTVQWEIGSIGIIEADKVKSATEKEAAEWFPVGE